MALTPEQRLEKARRINERHLEAMRLEEVRRSLKVGDSVSFNLRSKYATEPLTGTILGMKEDSNGFWVKVQVGEGFDTETHAVRAAAILANHSAEGRTKGK